MPLTLKVMAWNIQGGEDASLDKIAEYIRRTEAQIVFLSEIKRDSVDQPAKLAELLNLPFWRFWGSNGDTGINGVAVLSAFPLDPVTPNEVADFKTPDYIVQTRATINNTAHYLFANHFHYANPCLRLADARRQNAIVNALPSNSAVIMAGDLNCKPLSPIVSTLKQTLTEAFLQLPSYNYGDVDGRIDYIFFRGPYQVKSYDLNDHWDLGPPTGPSDHPFVVATLAEVVSLRVDVTPSPLPFWGSVGLTVSARDARTGAPVPGRVFIDNADVTATNTAFNYTFLSNSVTGVVNAPGYPATNFKFPFYTPDELKAMVRLKAFMLWEERVRASGQYWGNSWSDWWAAKWALGIPPDVFV